MMLWDAAQGRAAAARLPGAVLASVLDPAAYLGEGTIWRREVAGGAMPIASDSAALADWMQRSSPNPWVPAGAQRPFGAPTSLNRSTYGTQPIPVYIIDSAAPGCPRHVMTTEAALGASPQEKRIFLEGEIPWPAHVIPARNHDRGLALWDVRTGLMREWFHVERTGPGSWHAQAGGFSVTTPGLRELGRTNWATQLQRGSSAVCGMHNELGFIGAQEVLAGEIRHALAFTTANFARRDAPSWPAKLTDGTAPPEEPSPTHGQWGRIAADVDPQRDPRTGRPYRPLTRLLIRAAQRYGLVGTDTNTWCHAFNAESGYEAEAVTGTDPWADGGLIARALSPGSPAEAFDVSDFPWDRTEWAPVDWGRPSPDVVIRPGDYWPAAGASGAGTASPSS